MRARPGEFALDMGLDGGDLLAQPLRRLALPLAFEAPAFSREHRDRRFQPMGERARALSGLLHELLLSVEEAIEIDGERFDFRRHGQIEPGGLPLADRVQLRPEPRQRRQDHVELQPGGGDQHESDQREHIEHVPQEGRPRRDDLIVIEGDRKQDGPAGARRPDGHLALGDVELPPSRSLDLEPGRAVAHRRVTREIDLAMAERRRPQRRLAAFGHLPVGAAVEPAITGIALGLGDFQLAVGPDRDVARQIGPARVEVAPDGLEHVPVEDHRERAAGDGEHADDADRRDDKHAAAKGLGLSRHPRQASST